MKRVLLAFLFSLCLCAQAWAFTLANVGTATSNTGGSTSVTTSSFNVAAGSFVYVIVADQDAQIAGFGNVIDSNSNAYTLSNAGDGIVNGFFFFYGTAQTGITLTYTEGGANRGCGISVFMIAGSNGTEDAGAAFGNSGSSSSPTVTSHAPSVSGELFIGFVGNATGGSAPTFTQAGGWSTSPISSFSFTCGSGGSLTCSVNAGYLTNAGSSSETYAPSFSASTNWYVGIEAIEPGAGVTKKCTITLMGAGPC